MNKIYYSLIAIFIASSVVSCSDDNNNNNNTITTKETTTTTTTNDPSSKYVDYAYYTAKSMGYEGNVSEVEKTIFEPSTINLTNNEISNEGSKKERYFFDPNGALIKHITPIDYQEDNSTNYIETTYIYDSLYREIEHIQYYSTASSSYYHKIKTEYNAENNTATRTYYKSDNGSTDHVLQYKYTYKLNENGRIDESDIDHYYPNSDYTKSVLESETPVTSNYTLKVERDSKNNVLNTYSIQTYADNKTKAWITNHYEQSIIYYNGTVTKPSNILKNETIVIQNTTLSKDLGIKGNPKSYTKSSYISTKYKSITIDNSTNTPKNGELEYQVKYEFDANGYLNQHDQEICSEYPIHDNSSSASYKYYTYSTFTRKYEYDTQNRVKTYYNKITHYSYNYDYTNKRFDYDQPTLNTTSTKTIYSYDDVNNIVTEEVYTLDNTDATSYYNTENDIETRSYSFSDTPSSNKKTITKRDDVGNIVLSYDIDTNYNNSGLVNNQSIVTYATFDITYY